MMPRPFVVLVAADEHPKRDEWVDDRARDAQRVLNMVPVDDAHYRGVWTAPMSTRVHVFALDADLIAIESLGGYVPPRCPSCDCREFPQDGPGVHAAHCPLGWPAYEQCRACLVPPGAPCVRPGSSWPHEGRKLRWSSREVRREALR